MPVYLRNEFLPLSSHWISGCRSYFLFHEPPARPPAVRFLNQKPFVYVTFPSVQLTSFFLLVFFRLFCPYFLECHQISGI